MPEREIAVSVIVYARNAQKNLPRCLRALQNQTLAAFENMEIIVMDADSDDRTYEIALEFQTAEPDFFRVHRQNNADPNAARKAGLALARGEYVAFRDAGEPAPPHIYEALYNACEAGGAEMAGAGGAHLWSRALRGMLVRRDFLLAHGLPVKTGYARAGQLAAYDTLRKLVRPAELPLFCAGWTKTLRGICLEEYRTSGGGAAFYGRMISLAQEPQAAEALALAARGALAGEQRKFFEAFRARDWARLEKQMRRLKFYSVFKVRRGE